MEIINQALTSLKDLPRSIQALIVIAVLAGFLTFSYFQFNKKGEEVAPTKQVKDINQGNTQNSTTGSNTNANTISI